MEINKITQQIIQVICEDQLALTSLFLRFQEHYESPKFRGKIFTLGQFRDWYARENGGFTYHTDWNGFNIPSYVLEPFIKGLFDPLTDEERQFLDLFKDRTDKYYIIGTHEDASGTLDHEVCHGLYYINSEYQKEVDQVLFEMGDLLIPLKQWLLKSGYAVEVLEDECHAYVSADWKWLKEKHSIEIPEEYHKQLRAIKEKHFKEGNDE